MITKDFHMAKANVQFLVFIFLDGLAAFDIADHTLLLDKLSLFHLQDTTLLISLLPNFLSVSSTGFFFFP